MILIGLVIIIAVLMVLAVPRLRRMLLGAPAAVTSVNSPGSATAAHIPAGAAGAPAAIPGGLPSPRVSFAPGLMQRGAVDGGWWPRSATHLPSCLALSRRWTSFPGVRVQRVAVHRDEWDDIPRKLTADNGHFARVGWFTTISRQTVSVTIAGSREPIALLMVPPVPAQKPPGPPWTRQPPAQAPPRPPTSLPPCETLRDTGEYGPKPGNRPRDKGTRLIHCPSAYLRDPAAGHAPRPRFTSARVRGHRTVCLVYGVLYGLVLSVWRGMGARPLPGALTPSAGAAWQRCQGCRRAVRRRFTGLSGRRGA
jgi:Family of unknown function (DUF5994)